MPKSASSLSRAVLLGGTMLTLACGVAEASGFAIREQSGTAQGNAFAGATAGAEDISYMFFNPAGLTRFEGNQLVATVSYILPSARADSATATTALGSTIQGSTSSGEIGSGVPIPALYAMWSPHPVARLGIGVTAPYGLKTENDPTFVGRYHGTYSELATVNVNPVAAFKVNDWFSFGVGAQIQYAYAKLESAIDFGTLAGVGALSGTLINDGATQVEGDDIGFGVNAGVLFEPWDGTRFGFAYRSQVNHKLHGDATFDLGNGIGPTVAAGSGGAFVNTEVTARLSTPHVVSAGAYHEFDDEWAVMGELAWTNWSSFETIEIVFANPAQAASVTPENWEDTWFAALGVTYSPGDFDFRLGVAYDQTPIPDNKRTPRVPGNDRLWISTGIGYEPVEGVSLDIAYTHIFVDDGDINLTATGADRVRGNLMTTYENSVDIISLSGAISF